MSQPDASYKPTWLFISAAGRTDTGRVREQNEDAIALCEPSDPLLISRLGSLYILADGAGGHAAGEIASRIAVETITAEYYHQYLFPPPTGDTLQPSKIMTPLDESVLDLDLAVRQLQQAFLAAHARILELAACQPEYYGMITTCLAAVVKDTSILIAHIGDSRAYLIRASSESSSPVTQLTSDHSMATAMVQADILSNEQAQHSQTRHIILRALGERKQKYAGPDIIVCQAQAGDHLVLSCDGLWSTLPANLIASVVERNTPQAACDELIQLANEAGGEDNISVIVLSFSPHQETGTGGLSQ
jgi:serine/threonine protein phosphatase PrpC